MRGDADKKYLQVLINNQFLKKLLKTKENENKVTEHPTDTREMVTCLKSWRNPSKNQWESKIQSEILGLRIRVHSILSTFFQVARLKSNRSSVDIICTGRILKKLLRSAEVYRKDGEHQMKKNKSLNGCEAASVDRDQVFSSCTLHCFLRESTRQSQWTCKTRAAHFITNCYQFSHIINRNCVFLIA